MKRIINSNSEKGFAIILVVVMLAILSLFPVIGEISRISSIQANQQEKHSVQVNDVAKAGIEDAIGWFRKQPLRPIGNSPDVSPVSYPHIDMAFYPKHSSAPQLSETISNHMNTAASFYVVEDSPGVPNITYPDRYIGLVSTYAINASKRLIARYELRRYRDPNESLLPPDNTYVVQDISHKRISPFVEGMGLVWELKSTGYIYREFDSEKRFDEEPNEIVAKSMASTEVRYLHMEVPTKLSAFIVNDFSKITLVNATINGKNEMAIMAYPKCDSSLVWGNPDPYPCPSLDLNRNVAAPSAAPNLITGSGTPLWGILDPTETESPDIDVFDFFAARLDDMRLMADLVIKKASEMPDLLTAMGITYIEGGLTLDDFPRGAGILFVDGDLNITAVNKHEPSRQFNGLFFVKGSLIIDSTDSNFIMSGITVVGDYTVITENAKGNIVFNYDGNWLENVRTQIAQYRRSAPIQYSLSAMQ